MRLESEQEDDGRWIAEVPELPGVMAYAATERQAREHALVLALRVLADRIEHDEPVPDGVLAQFGLAAQPRAFVNVAPMPRDRHDLVPHAATSAKVLEDLRRMTPEEVRQTFVRSGIYTEDGVLIPEYGGPPRKRPARTPSRRPARPKAR